ncbi:hypothetical protein BDN71DRAFT_1573249 [Pleurotus eryngii]|uniref:Uncharacterized protein n=1 Tax=Pleurotus eryngii TaxID=5323 RepID=A0A9P5ZS98_PLEER|nr:hypothetical protein BDN71DRAFT_1573249 [Pleurotus eryngii]
MAESEPLSPSQDILKQLEASLQVCQSKQGGKCNKKTVTMKGSVKPATQSGNKENKGDRSKDDAEDCIWCIFIHNTRHRIPMALPVDGPQPTITITSIKNWIYSLKKQYTQYHNWLGETGHALVTGEQMSVKFPWYNRLHHLLSASLVYDKSALVNAATPVDTTLLMASQGSAAPMRPCIPSDLPVTPTPLARSPLKGLPMTTTTATTTKPASAKWKNMMEHVQELNKEKEQAHIMVEQIRTKRKLEEVKMKKEHK